MAALELEIPARTEYLGLIRLVVAAAATLEPSVSDARLDDLRLAVTEACANAIDAQDPRRDARPIHVRCELSADRVEVFVRDNGGGFDPDELGELPAATDPRRLRHERGLGIPLMRLLADEVSFEAVPGGTEVRVMVRRGTGER